MLISFKDLEVWKKGVALVKVIYRITDQFPKSELYSLSSQMRRCAVSIPSNVAEGYKRRNRKEYIQFLGVANGSAGELETQIIIAEELYPGQDFREAKNLIEEIQKMLTVLMKKLGHGKILER
ncbi:MAG: four helix bundle protein [Patescibacteria group bacterium]